MHKKTTKIKEIIKSKEYIYIKPYQWIGLELSIILSIVPVIQISTPITNLYIGNLLVSKTLYYLFYI